MESPQELKHSRIGIASFAISLGVGALMFGLFVLAGLLQAFHADRVHSLSTLLGLCMIAMMFVDFVAVGLGIGALCESNRRRLFGGLGLALSTLTILFVFGLCVIGLRMSGRI